MPPIGWPQRWHRVTEGRHMRQYILRRLLMLIPVLVAVSIIIFLLMRVVPGDVATVILMGSGGEGAATEEALRELRHKLGTDRPLYEQYATWVWGLLRLDVGPSFYTRTPVFEEIGDRIPVSVELAFLTGLISLIIALPLGVLSALRQDTWTDYVMRVVTIGGIAMPTFWSGTLIILALVLYFRWLPPIGYVGLLSDPWTNFQQMIWPALALGYYFSAVVSRMTRSCMLEVLRQDYIRTAWAKGLRERIVVLRHAMKNALLPVITITGIQVAYLIGGTVIMESVFVLPGIGKHLVDSIRVRDYPVVQTIVVLFALVVSVANLLVDVVYAWVDPRIRYT